MSTTRRPLGHGPQPRPADAPDTPATAPAERIRAVQADVAATLPAADRIRADLARYRERGVLTVAGCRCEGAAHGGNGCAD